jgi:hypothetical protein
MISSKRPGPDIHGCWHAIQATSTLGADPLRDCTLIDHLFEFDLAVTSSKDGRQNGWYRFGRDK